MYCFHFQTNISAAFINSLAVCVKIAGISVQIQYTWGESIMIIKKKKSIKAFLGHDRERKTASQDSSMTPQWAAHLECSSLAHTEEKKKKITGHLKRNKRQESKEQTTFLLHTVYNSTRHRFSIQTRRCQAQNMIAALWHCEVPAM